MIIRIEIHAEKAIKIHALLCSIRKGTLLKKDERVAVIHYSKRTLRNYNSEN